MLAGMGVPDLRGGLGTPTFYTSSEGVSPRESENVVHVRPGADGTIETHLIGPRHPKDRSDIRFGLSRPGSTRLRGGWSSARPGRRRRWRSARGSGATGCA